MTAAADELTASYFFVSQFKTQAMLTPQVSFTCAKSLLEFGWSEIDWQIVHGSYSRLMKVHPGPARFSYLDRIERDQCSNLSIAIRECGSPDLCRLKGKAGLFLRHFPVWNTLKVLKIHHQIKIITRSQFPLGIGR